MRDQPLIEGVDHVPENALLRRLCRAHAVRKFTPIDASESLGEMARAGLHRLVERRRRSVVISKVRRQQE